MTNGTFRRYRPELIGTVKLYVYNNYKKIAALFFIMTISIIS
jgi:hypothetical protein